MDVPLRIWLCATYDSELNEMRFYYSDPQLITYMQIPLFFHPSSLEIKQSNAIHVLFYLLIVAPNLLIIARNIFQSGNWFSKVRCYMAIDAKAWYGGRYLTSRFELKS